MQAGGEGVQRLLLRGGQFGVVDALCGGREAGDVRGEVAAFKVGNVAGGMRCGGVRQPGV